MEEGGSAFVAPWHQAQARPAPRSYGIPGVSRVSSTSLSVSEIPHHAKAQEMVTAAVAAGINDLGKNSSHQCDGSRRGFNGSSHPPRNRSGLATDGAIEHGERPLPRTFGADEAYLVELPQRDRETERQRAWSPLCFPQLFITHTPLGF